LRIVSGIYKGRKLQAPSGPDVRPTSDRARESIFNVIAHGLANWSGELDGASVVDVFCGTGAMGLEALSRGAAHATLIDSSRPALAVAKKNIAPAWRDTMLLKMDATHLAPPPLAAQAPCGVAFVDAPYAKGLTLPSLIGLKNKGWLAPGGLAAVEIGAEEELALPLSFELLDERAYGAAKVVFLQIRD